MSQTQRIALALRILVLLAAASTSAVAQKVSCAERACDRWSIKTSTVGDRVAVEQSATLDELIAYRAPDHAMDTGAKAAYQKKRLPGAVGSHGEHEGTIIRVEGFLRLMQHDTGDSDYHLQLSPTWDSTADSTDVIVEVPDPDLLPDGELKTRAAAMRTWLDHLAAKGAVSSGKGNLLQRKTWVFVEGQLFFDHHHYPGCGQRGKQQRHAVTCWEIHPITAIGFANKANMPKD
ncbi:MAG: hypothetical protein HY084_12010 [Gemmatimonadetes bacterium]|nr:hypothetical protein [Gemmatimonadota bacterium]